MEPEADLIEIPRGRAWAETWSYLDEDDEAIDLTGCTGELHVRAKANGEPLVIGTWTPTEETGEAELEISEEDVALLDGHRVLHWVLLVTDSLGEVDDARGVVRMIDDI
jgi:hypothetical protein